MTTRRTLSKPRTRDLYGNQWRQEKLPLLLRHLVRGSYQCWGALRDPGRICCWKSQTKILNSKFRSLSYLSNFLAADSNHILSLDRHWVAHFLRFASCGFVGWLTMFILAHSSLQVASVFKFLPRVPIPSPWEQQSNLLAHPCHLPSDQAVTMLVGRGRRVGMLECFKYKRDPYS